MHTHGRALSKVLIDLWFNKQYMIIYIYDFSE